MVDTIDFQAEKSRREMPDADCRKVDDFGRPMGLYALDYKYEGGSWPLEVWAYSTEDAQARVVAMRDSLTLLGQIYSIVPA